MRRLQFMHWLGTPDTERGRTFQDIMLSLMAVISALLAILIICQPEAAARATFSLIFFDALGLLLLYANRKGLTRLASWLLIAGLVLEITFMSPAAGGIRAPGVGMYYVFALLGAVLLGETAGIVVAICCGLLGLGLVLGEQYKLIPPQTVWYTATTYWVLNCLFMGLVIALLRYATRSATAAQRRAEIEVTERKRAEHKLAFAIDAGQVGIWDRDLKSGMLTASERTLDILGLQATAGAPISFEIFERLVHPDDAEKLAQAAQMLSRGGQEAVRLEYRILRSDGRVRYVEVGAVVQLDEDRRPLRIMGTIIDTTSRKELEIERERLVLSLSDRVGELQLLYRATQMLRDRGIDQTALEELVHMLPDAWDERECFAARISYGDIEASTPNWGDAAHTMCLKFSTSEATGVIEIGCLPHCTSTACDSALSGKRNLLQSISEVLVSSIERDIAERSRQQLEGQLRTAEKLEAIGKLASGIAHDFNNILAAIRAFAELLVSDLPPNSQSHTHATRIFLACKRATDLVHQILTYSRANDAPHEPTRVARVAVEISHLFGTKLADGATLAINNDLPEAVVMANPSQLTQVLLNLVVNANDSLMGEAGRVVVSFSEVNVPAEQPPPFEPGLIGAPDRKNDAYIFLLGLLKANTPYVRMSVADNGVGIPLKVARKIFDPFFTTKDKRRGSGLGLAVVSSIVRAHNGAIAVDSREGVGTTFHIYLPAYKLRCGREGLPYIPLTKVAVSNELTGTGRILVVDDEVDIADAVSAGLTKFGYETAPVYTAVEALEIFEEDPTAWDVVLTDQSMPHMKGLELIRRMKVIRPQIKAILWTGYSDEGTEEQALARGADRYFNKPLDTIALASTLRKLIARAAV